MAVQVSYPGVYIEEFAPGAPIEGVGTNTAAFIGTAKSGPISKPVLIQSWDAFVATFGGFITEPPTSYLAPAVYGFFFNGGTTCYIVRAGTGSMAAADVPNRGGGASPDAVFKGQALQEGPAGEAISLQIQESSALADLLTKANSTEITALSADRKELTVKDNSLFVASSSILLKKGSDNLIVTLTSKSGTDKLTFSSAIPGTTDYTGGRACLTVTTLAINGALANVTAMATDRKELTINDETNFAVGDHILLKKTGAPSELMIVGGKAKNKLTLSAPIPGAVDFSGGTAQISDLSPGQQRFRVRVPNGLSLSQAFPPGTSISITQGATGEVCTVDSAGGDMITLGKGLSNTYGLANSDPTKLPQIVSLEFDLIISQGGSENERFSFLSINPNHPSYWGTVTPKLVTLENPPAPKNPLPADLRPVVGIYPLQNGKADDRKNAEEDVNKDPKKYLDLLKPIDEVALVCAPGFTDSFVQQALISHCEAMRDRFAVLDSKPNVEPGNGIRDQFSDVRSELGFAALYYPWIQVRNPSTGKSEFWPPSGHVTGVIARTDAERGVHKAPANANIRGALGLERKLTNEEQGPLNMMGINVLRVFPGQSQPMVWGARTTATNRNWQYVNVRRLFLFLEESIQEGINWAIFEPNNLQLWQKLKRSITEFLTRVWREGALFGEKAENAFYVRIDEALNPPSTLALGRLYIEIGARPTYPAEFIIVRIGIWQGGSDVSEG